MHTHILEITNIKLIIITNYCFVDSNTFSFQNQF